MTANYDNEPSPNKASSEPRDSLPAGPLLFIRMDRIGDLVLTLGADSLFIKDETISPVDWWIAPNLGFIADHARPRRRVREMNLKISFKEFRQLLRELKNRKYQMVVVFHAPWWVSPLLWLARIPNRLGVKSQWHTFLFLNKGLRQKRSLAAFNEYEYNVRLVEQGLALEEGTAPRDALKIEINEEWQNETLSDHSLKKGDYSVIHPGMSGSAKNWSTANYVSWIQEASKKETIVITGTTSDASILDPIRSALAAAKNNGKAVIWLDGKLSGPKLLHVLGGARVILAPSTGVAHLGAALSRPVIGIYSPVKVQSAKRWGPQGSDVKVLSPDVECPGKKACLGATCPLHDCMDSITTESVRAVWQ